MAYLLNIEHKIDKIKIFKRLHIAANTETYRSADDAFLKLYEIIRANMKLTGLYLIVDPFDVGSEELLACTECMKYVLCFISSNDDIKHIVNEMMTCGNYLMGYLLNEMATEIIFNASNQMNQTIQERSKKLGYKLTKRYAAGDGDIELKYQQLILDVLKKEVITDAYLTEGYMIVPEKSMLYLYGLEKITRKEYCINTVKTYKKTENLVVQESCKECSNLNCQYRNAK